MDEKLKTDTIYHSALKRIGKPEEVAKVAKVERKHHKEELRDGALVELQ